MAEILRITNHGPLITATNYWELPESHLGKFYVSLNSGAFRLLVPPIQEPALNDMKASKECVVSRGPWPMQGLADAVEILFDDRTDNPFSLHLSIPSFDRLPLDTDQGKEWILSVWTRPRRGRPHKALERPCWYRRVISIPYLKPKGE